MRKVHEKSILLGIGIGMIITAIAGMIFSTGTQKELSKEEIISIAKTKYGLVEQVKFLNGDNTSNDSTNTTSSDSSTASTASQSTTADSTLTPSTTTENPRGKSTIAQSTIAQSTIAESNTTVTDKQQIGEGSSNTTADRNIIVEIKDGYKSQDIIDQLLDKGVISNREKFSAVLDSYDAATKIRVGTFKFRKNDDLDYIVKTICKLK